MHGCREHREHEPRGAESEAASSPPLPDSSEEDDPEPDPEEEEEEEEDTEDWMARDFWMFCRLENQRKSKKINQITRNLLLQKYLLNSTLARESVISMNDSQFRPGT